MKRKQIVRHIEAPSGVAVVHSLTQSEACAAQWQVNDEGFIFAECEHYLTLTDAKIER